MAIPILKRVRTSSGTELRNWLSKESADHSEVMLVVNTKKDAKTYVDLEAVDKLLAIHGWNGGRRFTLSKHMLGYVISR